MMEAMRLPHLIPLMLPINLWSQWALLTQTEEGRILFKKRPRPRPGRGKAQGLPPTHHPPSHQDPEQG